MMKIFAYTKRAGMTAEILTKLTEAGYIPVPVKSLDCVKVIEPTPDGDAGAVMRAALYAIGSAPSSSTVPEAFGRRLARELRRAPDEVVPDPAK